MCIYLQITYVHVREWMGMCASIDLCTDVFPCSMSMYGYSSACPMNVCERWVYVMEVDMSVYPCTH